MVPFQTTILPNGAVVVVRPLANSKMATLNVMYGVGSRNEDPATTGLAHYLEHLMFGGSAHVPHYDEVIQSVGGINNAYTCSDVTSYWVRLPADRLETALWVEADRMAAPTFPEQVVETQRSVVLEEFKESTLNQPYGDVWHALCAAAYQVHPYRWPTIGQRPEHIRDVSRQQIVEFHRRFYTPSNAVICVVGGVNPDKVQEMVTQWFGALPAVTAQVAELPIEPPQVGPRCITRAGRVPQNRLYKAYHMPGRTDPCYWEYKVLSYLLTEGNSSLLYKTLVEERKLVTGVESYLTGSHDPGLFIVEASLLDSSSFTEVELVLEEVLQQVLQEKMALPLFEKAINQLATEYAVEQLGAGEQADALARGALLGDIALFDKEMERMKSCVLVSFSPSVQEAFHPSVATTLYYCKEG